MWWLRCIHVDDEVVEDDDEFSNLSPVLELTELAAGWRSPPFIYLHHNFNFLQYLLLIFPKKVFLFWLEESSFHIPFQFYNQYLEEQLKHRKNCESCPTQVTSPRQGPQVSLDSLRLALDTLACLILLSTRFRCWPSGEHSLYCWFVIVIAAFDVWPCHRVTR